MSLSDPDLRRLASLLTTHKSPSLIPLLPALTTHILRSRDALSRASDQRLKGTGALAEPSLLVHKVRTSITSLLTGRTREGRLVGAVLAKAVVDVGGCEVLRTSEPWARGLLAILQKADPSASKELALTALVQILTLIHPYQTLVREIATPILPALLSAATQLLNPPSTAAQPSRSLVAALLDAIVTLIPLHPATLRPFAAHLRTLVRRCVFPELSSPSSAAVRRAARRLLVSLHHTAPKAGGADDWAGLLRALIREAHTIADQIFRSVLETWASAHGHVSARRDLDSPPHGGSSASADLVPPWTSVDAGARHLVALLEILATALLRPTKVAVPVPVGALVDLIVRVSSIARQNPRKQTWEQALETEPGIGREERGELWCAIPGLHVAAMGVADALVRRLGRNAMPVGGELLDATVRVIRSGINVEEVREVAYRAGRTLVEVMGVGMSKQAVAALDPLMAACCRDLQNAGDVQTEPARASAPDSKKYGSGNANVDLLPQARPVAVNPIAISAAALAPPHVLAARALLTALFTHLPQHHLRPAARGLLDRSAVLTRDRDAIAASVLNPYRDPAGRMGASLLPFLARGWPRAQEVEVLRTNLRASERRWDDAQWGEAGGGGFHGDGDGGDGGDARDEAVNGGEKTETSETFLVAEGRADGPGTRHDAAAETPFAVGPEPAQAEKPEEALPRSPFRPRDWSLRPAEEPRANGQASSSSSSLKRPGEMADPRPPKRRETSPPFSAAPPVPDAPPSSLPPAPADGESGILAAEASVVGIEAAGRASGGDGDAGGGGADDDTDESVHLDMQFDDDEDEDEDDEDEEDEDGDEDGDGDGDGDVDRKRGEQMLGME